MKKKLCGIFFFLCAALVSVNAQEKPIITVLDFTGTSVAEAEMRSIINVLSSDLFKSGYFTVIDISQREQILNEMEFSGSGCSDESCRLEIVDGDSISYEVHDNTAVIKKVPRVDVVSVENTLTEWTDEIDDEL
jgi:hypothetical protein